MSGKAAATRERILKAARKLVIERGYAGTTIDDILLATKMTKGAFFYHFKSKADLAQALIEQYAEEDTRFFRELSAKADEQTEDALENVLLFLALFEDYLSHRPKQLRSCLYAAYTHELDQFEAPILKAIRSGIGQWRAIYREKFGRLIANHQPRLPVDADDLATMIVSLIEGGLIQARIDGDPHLVVRQSVQFRGYLQLLFEPPPANRRQVT